MRGVQSMSREDWEQWENAREERARRRRERLEASHGEALAIDTLCRRLNLWFVHTNPHHWRFGPVGCERTRLSYWPSSMKMQRHPGTVVLENVTTAKLQDALRELASR